MSCSEHLHPKRFSGTRLLPVLLTALLWLPGVSAQPAPKVTLLIPAPEGGSIFWTQMTGIMRAAAEDLGIDLTLVYSRNNSYSEKKDGLAALEGPDRPDYFLCSYWVEATEHHLERAEQLRIHTFIFNSGVASKERAQTGLPRGKYRYWMAQMVPNDYKAAYTLADFLINKAKAAGKIGKDGKVHLILTGGDGVGNSSEEERYAGVKKRIAEDNDAVLDRLILTGWERDTAYHELFEALKQYRETSVIWSISDRVSLAAIDAARDSGKTPERDIFIGGMNWSLENLNAVASGNLTAIMGGQFLEGIKALVLIYDYHHGLDFQAELGVDMRTPLSLITIDNAREYLNTLSRADWRKVDFKQFSKKNNPGLKKYNLTLETLLESLAPELPEPADGDSPGS